MNKYQKLIDKVEKFIIEDILFEDLVYFVQ